MIYVLIYLCTSVSDVGVLSVPYCTFLTYFNLVAELTSFFTIVIEFLLLPFIAMWTKMKKIHLATIVFVTVVSFKLADSLSWVWQLTALGCTIFSTFFLYLFFGSWLASVIYQNSQLRSFHLHHFWNYVTLHHCQAQGNITNRKRYSASYISSRLLWRLYIFHQQLP